MTGASSGIGRAIAVELAKAGTAVVVSARRADRLDELVQEIAAFGGRAVAVAGDISDPAVRERLVETARTDLGGLDVLVNNAGFGALGPFAIAAPERLRKVMEVNFFSLVEMTRAALPLLRQGNQPIVVNVSSVLGHRGVPYNNEYCASKFAVQGFSEVIRAEFSTLGIDVLVVSPGTTETEFFDVVIEKGPSPSWPQHKPVSSEFVARRTVAAIRAGRHEVMPYWPGKLLCWVNRISPRLVDYLMTRYL